MHGANAVSLRQQVVSAVLFKALRLPVDTTLLINLSKIMYLCQQVTRSKGIAFTAVECRPSCFREMSFPSLSALDLLRSSLSADMRMVISCVSALTPKTTHLVRNVGFLLRISDIYDTYICCEMVVSVAPAETPEHQHVLTMQPHAPTLQR